MKNILLLIISILFIKTGYSQISNKGTFYVGEQATVALKADFENLNSGEFWNNGDVHAFNNWNNDGIVDYTINVIDNGTTNFVGNSNQVISGTAFNYFYDVVFDNVSSALPYDLQGDISVANESLFNNGIISNKVSNGMFVFEENAIHTNTSNISHVNGKVIKNGDTDFDFPIGDSGFYRSALISQIDASDDFVGEFFFEDTNATYPTSNLANNLDFIDNTEYWTINRNNVTAQVLLTLSLDTATTAQEILDADIEDIHIARWNVAQQEWVDQGGVQDAANQTISALVENYGVFTLAIKKDGVVNNIPFPAVSEPLLFPLFVTPNSDGFNDTWHVIGASELEGTIIYIFDRYGKLLKTLLHTSQGWNGTYNGYDMPTSDYWYVANIKQGEKEFELKGHFTLKR